MRSKSLFFCVFLLLLLTVPNISSAWSGKMVGVSDGDTIRVLKDNKQVRIRLYGIDTPGRGQAFSKRAKEFTSEMVFGKVVEVGAINVDHYGRTVSLVYVEGKGVCDELIRAGLAWVYNYYCNLPLCEEWFVLQLKASDNHCGLWSEPNPIPPWEFRRKKRRK